MKIMRGLSFVVLMALASVTLTGCDASKVGEVIKAVVGILGELGGACGGGGCDGGSCGDGGGGFDDGGDIGDGGDLGDGGGGGIDVGTGGDLGNPSGDGGPGLRIGTPEGSTPLDNPGK